MFFKIPDMRFAIPGRRIGITLQGSGTTDGNNAAGLRDDNHPVIPGLPRDLGLFRDLIEKAVISKQPLLDVS